MKLEKRGSPSPFPPRCNKDVADKKEVRKALLQIEEGVAMPNQRKVCKKVPRP